MTSFGLIVAMIPDNPYGLSNRMVYILEVGLITHMHVMFILDNMSK